MQIPPKDIRDIEPPLSADMAGPDTYKWDPNYPGTIKPGTHPENFPLADVLASGVYERMYYTEVDYDDCEPVIHEPDEDLLEWIAKQGRLLPRDEDGDEPTVNVPDPESLAEDDLDFEQDDDKSMLEYYSRQRDGAADSSDFGGVSESSLAPSGL